MTDLRIGVFPEASNQAGARFIRQVKVHQEGVADMGPECFDGVGRGRSLEDFKPGEKEVLGNDATIEGIVLDEQYAGTFGGIGWVHGHGDSGVEWFDVMVLTGN
jgi:hypothetical protein